MQKPALAAYWLVLLWLLTAAAPGAAGSPDVLRVGLPSVPSTLDPATALDGPAALIARQVFDTLVQYREGSSDVEPGLASRWSVSRDGLTWTFRLREGARFHDGTPLAAQHVVTSLERQLFPNHPLAPDGAAVGPRLLRGAPGVVKEIRAPDERTVSIGLAQPYAPLLTVLAHPGLAVVLNTAPEGASPRWVGTGPWSVAETAAGRLGLEAQAAYWGGPPRLGRLVFVQEPDEAHALADLDGGALDLWIPPGPPSRLAGALSVPGWTIGYLALQTEKEPFNRKKVRQAVAAALDPALIATAVEPAAALLQSFVPPGVWGGRPAALVTQGNPAAARRLLAEAGLSRAISATLLLAGDSPAGDQNPLAEAIRAALGAAGITVHVQTVSPAEVKRLAQSGEHQMVLMEARAEGGDPHLLLYPISTSEGAIKGPSAWNVSFFRNARLDDLLIRGSQLSFRPERQRVYARAQGLLAEELPWIPLYVRRHWAVAAPSVRDLRLHPSGFHRLNRVWLDAR